MTNSSSKNPPQIPSGFRYMTVKPETVEIVDILANYTDPQCIYVFNSKNKAFDYYIPPNNFIQITSTLTDEGSHTMLLSTAMQCCEALLGMDVNFILAVKDIDILRWNYSPQSFEVNVPSVVDEINIKEYPKRFTKNGIRSFDKLPESTKITMKISSIYCSDKDQVAY
jgi:hypothetical protein